MGEEDNRRGELDVVMKVLGWRGRYQMMQVIVSMLCLFPLATNQLSIIFIARFVPFRCSLPVANQSQAQEYYRQNLADVAFSPQSSMRTTRIDIVPPSGRVSHGGLPGPRDAISPVKGKDAFAAFPGSSMGEDVLSTSTGSSFMEDGLISQNNIPWNEISVTDNDTRPIYLVRIDLDGIEQMYATKNVSFQECSIKVDIADQDGETKEVTMGCPNGYEYEEPPERSLSSEWDLVCGRNSMVATTQTIMAVGDMVGSVIFPTLADRVGRHRMIFISNLGLLASGLGAAMSQSYAVFTIMRFFMGAFQQGVGLCSTVLCVETMVTEKRTLPVILGCVLWATSMILMTPIAYFLRNLSWRYTQGIMCATTAYCFLHYWLTDESIRWLAANGKTKQVEKILRRAARMNRVDPELVIATYRQAEDKQEPATPIVKDGFVSVPTTDTDIKMEEMTGNVHSDPENVGTVLHEEGTQGGGEEESTKYSPMDIVRNKSLLISTVIMCLQWMTHGLVYYGLHLMSGRLADNLYLGFFLNAVADLPGAVALGMTANRFGRKNSSMFFGMVSGLSLIISVIIVAVTGDDPTYKPAVTAFSVLGKMAVSCSWSVLLQFTPEIYPTNIRSAGLGLASMASRLGSMAAPYASPLGDLAVWAPGVMFGVSIFGSSLLLRFLPESTGHELPQRLAQVSTWDKQGHDGNKTPKNSAT